MVIASVILAACTLETPEIMSGEGSIYRDGRPVHSWQISQSQVVDINAWLASHRSGWAPTVNTYAPRILLQLKARDGSLWSLNVFPNGVVVNGRGHQFAQNFEAGELSLLDHHVGP